MNIIKYRGEKRDSYGHLLGADLLVGHDINGKEVYEGDRVIDQFGGEWKIELHAVIVDLDGGNPHDLTYEEDVILTLDEDDDDEDDDND